MDEEVKILCVDDEANVLRALTRIFLDSDYEILTAESGEEGLEIFNSEQPIQLIISDYRMPKMNGVEFLREVKKIQPETVRIVLSGYAETSSIVEAINEGQIYKFVPKPWNDDELKVTITQALEHYFAKQKNIKLAMQLEERNEELYTINNNLEQLVAERTADVMRQNKVLTASQNILDSLPVAVLGIDPEGLIVQCNKKGIELFSMEEGNIMGLEVTDSLPEEVAELVDKVAENGTVTDKITNNGSSLDVKGSYMKHSNGQEGIILVFDKGGEE